MIDQYSHLQPVESEIEIRRAQALIADVADEPGGFRAEWLKEHGWTVVPVESADHFTETDITLLSAAFRQAGHSECLAVATEPLVNTPLCYKVPTTEAGLREFNQATWAFFFILLPEDRSCAVLCTKNDYYLVGGSQAFVTLALDADIPTARANFAAFAANSPHPTMREILCGIAERHEDITPEATTSVSPLPPVTRP